MFIVFNLYYELINYNYIYLIKIEIYFYTKSKKVKDFIRLHLITILAHKICLIFILDADK